MLKVLAGLVIAAVIGTAVLVFPKDSNTPAPAAEITSPTSNDGSSETDGQTKGSYVDYYEGVIAATSGHKIIFFHAPWCPQCRALEADIKTGLIPGGLTIIKTDYDSMQELRQKYGVTIQTTLVKVDDQGNLIKKYVAYDEPTLDNLVANLL